MYEGCNIRVQSQLDLLIKHSLQLSFGVGCLWVDTLVLHPRR